MTEIIKRCRYNKELKDGWKSIFVLCKCEGWFFDNADFNLDNEYFFQVEIDKSQMYYAYKLCVSKRKSRQPNTFWGRNISAVSVITGVNGSGKTSLMRFITNNIGQGTTALNGEGVIYVVNQCGLYIVFHNCMNFCIEKGEEASEIRLIKEREYTEWLIQMVNTPLHLITSDFGKT